MPRALEIYFDYRSPFAYLLSEVIEEVATRHGVTPVWKPVDLHVLADSDQPAYGPSKAAYVVTDARRTAEYYGVPILPPQPFPVSSNLALRTAIVARQHDAFDAFHRAVFRAAWVEQRDIGSEAVLADVIRGVGGDPAAWLARARSLDVDDRLREFSTEARERKVFGVPTMLLDGEMFWGVDSLPQLEWRLAGSPPRRRAG
ncbi:MAG TPA: 2-hydroxychromene-2-carboxylate isomerase [Myxococcota bacterium]|jgi:2-hydroxychromene-2-carboxylate isomerase|nr:2-hydroxychromene-2-carboxylate isomerase [Myxococcota bacterium]